MDYKMIVTDLDGTLLNDNKKISEDDVFVLNKLHNKDVQIVIATGRNYFMAKNLIKQIGNLNPVILANNGAIIRKSETDEVLEKNYLNYKYFEEIYRHGLKYGLNPVLHVDEYLNGYDIIYEYENIEEVYLGYIKKDDHRTKLKKFTPDEINNILSVCYLADFHKVHGFYNEMRKVNNGKFNSFYNLNVGKRTMLEFLHPDGCKWRAIKKFSEGLNIKPESIISFGDDNNDIEMLKNSGIGIAMINGTDECIKAGDKTSEFDNNNSGVSHELRKFFHI